MTNPALQRSALLYGEAAMGRLAAARAIVFGVGGVGSWCAAALARSGVGTITMVDADVVDVSNINRQMPASTLTVGQPKAEVMAKMMREINPGGAFTPIQAFYSADNAADFNLADYDVVIDAIDSVASKAQLILHACSTPGLALFSSMGAARRLDPGMVEVAEFWKVKGCPLARALREKFKREEVFPRRKFKCVFSQEPPKGEPKGTSVAVTATFGLRLAALAIDRLASPRD